jgi:hypothetical protein
MTGTIHQEETSVLNVYALNTGAPIYLLKKKTKNQTLIALKALIDINTQ